MIDLILKLSKNLVTKSLFYLSIYSSFIVIYLNYDIVYSPDFEKYYNYFLFYSEGIDSTNLEQGNLYFFFIYLCTIIINSLIGEINNFELLNISVLVGNYIIYTVALIGFKKYLILNNFNEKKVYLSLIVLNFSPPTLILRMTLKPEILGLTLIVWSLLYYQLFNTQKNNKNLNLFLLFSVLISTLKVSIFLMFVVLLIFQIDLKTLFNDIKPYFKNIALFTLVLLSLHAENYLMNEMSIFEVSHDEKYNNSADLEFFTNFNSNELNDNPHKNFHNNSFRAITLLDTFSDYFELYWNSDHSNFNSSRKQFIIFKERAQNIESGQLPVISYEKNNRVLTYTGNINSRYIAEDEGENSLDEIRMRAGFYFTIVFYLLVLVYAFRYKKYRAVLLSPFIGIVLVAVSSLGLFPSKNFDPIAGDSVKTFYYSFFISISFVFFLNITLNIVKKYDKVLSFLIILFFTFIIGLPTEFNENINNQKIQKNNYLFTCEINLAFIEFDEVLNFQNCNSKNRSTSSLEEVKNINLKLSILRIPYFSIFLILFSTYLYCNPRKRQV